ncbi:phage tail protein [Actinophytocola glycyrrhizae]|uniref:Phage tail protein n=1 Tax=Actinophytocola glycyrrhizae TaxID=2044873 RepID=A0ABV9S903_9PSEU
MIPASPVQTAFAAPVALGSAIPKRSSGMFVPQYGMTMWFSVSVGIGAPGENLGLWSACNGLGVQFAAETLKVGGTYDRPTVLPGSVSYGNITLERAMTSVDSKKVQEWLRHVTEAWVNAPEGGAPKGPTGGGDRFHPGTAAKIELYHRLDEPAVASWRLRDVVPVSWSAPPLTTSSGGVAIEKLVLAHGGFLDTDGGGSSTVAGRGKFVLSGPGGSIHFQYNPDSVTVSRGCSMNLLGQQSRDEYEYEMGMPGDWTIAYHGLVVEGAETVRTTTDLLRRWIVPDPARATAPTPLDVRLGDGSNTLLSRHVALTNVGLTFTRFTRMGTPSRASVDLSFVALQPQRGAQPRTGGDGRPRDPLVSRQGT